MCSANYKAVATIVAKTMAVDFFLFWSSKKMKEQAIWLAN